MKVDIEKVSNLERRLNIEIPADIVDAELDKYYKEVQKTAQLQGFRPGKAPLNIIKKTYKDRVEKDVASQLIRDHYVKALDEHNLDPVNYPTIDYDTLTEGSPLKFTASFEVRPEVELKKYQGLDVVKEKLNLDEKTIDGVLQNIRESKAELVPVFEDRAAQKGDVVEIDFMGRIDGAPFPGGSAQGQTLEIGASRYIPGFEEGVEGMRPGQSKTVPVTFPDTYGAKDLAGKKAEFEITLKGIKRKQLPELNDEFARSIGEHRDLAHLREEIEKDVRAGEEKRVRDEMKNRILRALVDGNPMEVPKSMVAEQKKILIEDVHHKLEQQGMGHDEYEKYIEKWDKDFDKSAAFVIKSSLLLNAIAQKENLAPTDADLEQKYESYAKQSGIELEKIKAFYSKPENRSRLKFQLLEERVVDFLIDKAKVKEVPKDKLPKEDEAEA